MPTIVVLSHNLLMESFLVDAFRMEGWNASALPLSSDVANAMPTLEHLVPDVLLLEFHPSQVSRYALLLTAMSRHARFNHLPVLVSHYVDEPLDCIQPLLLGHYTKVLTHDYDLDTLYSSAESLTKQLKQ